MELSCYLLAILVVNLSVIDFTLGAKFDESVVYQDYDSQMIDSKLIPDDEVTKTNSNHIRDIVDVIDLITPYADLMANYTFAKPEREKMRSVINSYNDVRPLIDGILQLYDGKKVNYAEFAVRASKLTMSNFSKSLYPALAMTFLDLIENLIWNGQCTVSDPRAIKFLQTWHKECRPLTFCQLGVYLGRKFPTVSFIAGIVGDYVPSVVDWLPPLVLGLGNATVCELTYNTCTYVNKK